jgi:YD repeat-containing protein
VRGAEARRKVGPGAAAKDPITAISGCPGLPIRWRAKFTTLQGVPKVTEIDRAANGTVAAATSYITYDSSGYLKTRTDWNGNQTAYTNNAHGMPTQIVYASGSPVSHTTNITYDTTWAHLAATIAENGVTTGITYDSSGNMATRTLTDTTSQTIPYSTNARPAHGPIHGPGPASFTPCNCRASMSPPRPLTVIRAAR